MSLLPIIAPDAASTRVVVAGGQNLSLATLAAGAGWDENSNIEFVITSAVGSSSVSSPALTQDIDTEFEVQITVSPGVVVSGKGGDGEDGATTPGPSNGGDAIQVNFACVIQNSGTIGGGGHGGRAGNGGGGGGGAGNIPGFGGNGSPAGESGTALLGGAGGGDGLDGGDLGESSPLGASGGLAGKSINGYSLVRYGGGGQLLGDTA